MEFDPKDYQKSIYTFKAQEIAQLSPWVAQMEMAKVAETLISNILREVCLKRVGVKDSIDVKVNYNIVEEQFVVYVPKIWCSKCGNRKAEFTHADKPYCKNCAEDLKKQLTETPKKKEKKK